MIHIVGDGVMVVFNDPIPCPDPSLQAARMAIEMRSQRRRADREMANPRIRPWFRDRYRRGSRHVGLIGFEDRSQYTAIGTVTNLASRLCGEAADGQILIDSKVKTALESRVETEDVGDLSLKGLRRPIRTCNVLGLRRTDDNIHSA